MRAHRIVGIALAGLLPISLLAACGSGSSSSSKGSSGVLNIGMPDGPQTHNNNPFLATSAAAHMGYRYMIYEPLAMTNLVKPAAASKPWLATRWDWQNNYTKLVLTARTGVKWSDGQPFNADDIAYTFQLLKDHAAFNAHGIALGDISASGDQVTMTFPISQFVNQNNILDQVIVPKHQWSKMANPETDAVANPIGTGPYTLTSFTPQTMKLKVRASGYWQAAPKVAELRYTSYTGNDAQSRALATDASEWSFTFLPNLRAVYLNKDPAHHKQWFPPVLGAQVLWLNVTKKPFDNAALRRAMSMVINRDDLFKQGEAGYFYPKLDSVTGLPTPAGDPFIAPEYRGRTQSMDVAGAKKLLAGNGFTLDGDTLKDSGGKPVTLTLSDPSGWSDYQTDLAIIKDNLSQIGIKADIDKANQDAWFKNVDTGNFDAILHWTNNGPTPYDLYQNVMDGSILKPIGTASPAGNYGRYDNPQATAALAQYANAADDTTRKAALGTIQKIMADEAPVIPWGAANAGAEYSTKHWVGWPDPGNPYAANQPTLVDALDVVLHLKAA
ncbi:MAG: ABC transporter substrate-binding protein [Mycobacteriales bacterium]